MTYTAPEFRKTAFHCPHCNAYAHMEWQVLYTMTGSGLRKTQTYFAECNHCHCESVWLEDSGRMLFPATVTAPVAHPDMPDDLLLDYNEAREIAAISPRGAAALLRLAIQKLCTQLCKDTGINSSSLDNGIAALVKKGLPIEIKEALDALRVIGNNAVHPGQLSPDDIAEVVNSLFDLVNHIVEDRVSQPKKRKALYDRLPEGARRAIEKRDN